MLMLCTMDIPKAQDQRLILRFKLFSLLQILKLFFCISGRQSAGYIKTNESQSGNIILFYKRITTHLCTSMQKR